MSRETARPFASRTGRTAAAKAVLLIACAVLWACSDVDPNPATPSPEPSPPPAPAPPPAPPPPPPQTWLEISGPGCYRSAYAGYGASGLACGIVTTSGDIFFDQRLNEEILLQQAFFGSFAPVTFFDECHPSEANALSLRAGFILFGIHMANKVVIQTGSNLAIAAVLAHEYAHQLQFGYGWSPPGASTVRDTELEADAFSGYYGALAKFWAGRELQAYFDLFFASGDFNFNDPSHHGTPHQRLAAGLIGLETATLGVPLTWFELHQVFTTRIANEVTRSSSTVSRLGGLPENVRTAIERGNRDFVEAVARGERDVRNYRPDYD